MTPGHGLELARTGEELPGFAGAAMTGNQMDEDLMTRRQVACLFRMTSAAVATWARRGLLPEVRDENGRPRYKRVDVEALRRSGFRRRARTGDRVRITPEPVTASYPAAVRAAGAQSGAADRK